MSSWVFRSGAGSASSRAMNPDHDSSRSGKTSCSGGSYAKVQSEPGCSGGGAASATAAGLRGGAEDRHGDVVGLRPERHLERHTDGEVVELAVDDVGHHARSLLQVDDGADVA